MYYYIGAHYLKVWCFEKSIVLRKIIYVVTLSCKSNFYKVEALKNYYRYNFIIFKA